MIELVVVDNTRGEFYEIAKHKIYHSDEYPSLIKINVLTRN